MSDKIKIGQGGFGNVYQVKVGHEKYAIKEIKIAEPGVKSLLELSIMKTYRHKYLNTATKISIKNGVISIWQELAECDLRKHITTQWPNGSKDPLAVEILYNTCLAISFLHQEEIVHCDIKPHNILKFGNVFKLCDFGTCVIISSQMKYGMMGTTKYSSPEMLLSNGWDKSTDIWSLGCLFHEVLTGKHFVSSIQRDEIEYRTRTAKAIQVWRESLGDKVELSQKLRTIKHLPINYILTGTPNELVLNMTKYNPHERYNIDRVMQNKWFDGFNKEKVKVGLSCDILDSESFDSSCHVFFSYAKKRKLEVSKKVLYKAIELHSRLDVKKNDIAYIEACLVISKKMHRSRIPHYHPITDLNLLLEKEIDICQKLNFRLHKCATNSLYVNIGDMVN